MEKRIEKLKTEFGKRFGLAGQIRLFFVPGRVNLIGEHTEYNGGGKPIFSINNSVCKKKTKKRGRKANLKETLGNTRVKEKIKERFLTESKNQKEGRKV